jgi:hypothetical protein
MAEHASEIREAVELAIDDVGDTLGVIGQQAHLTARASGKVAEKRDALMESGAEVKAKLGDFTQRLERRVPNGAQPTMISTPQWTKSVPRPAGDGGRRQKVGLRIGFATLLLVLLARRGRRGRAKPL